MSELGTGSRFDANKVRMDLMPAWAIKEVSKVLTMGAQKYGDHNWEKGMKWSRIFGSLERHLNAIKNGEDYDSESNLLHAAHVACNALFLLQYYKIYPQGDDRNLGYLRNVKIGLDIDGVIANPHLSVYNILKYDKNLIKEDYETWVKNLSWNMFYGARELWDSLIDNKEFWINIPLISEKIPFEPHCYITSRSVPKEWVEEWIVNNNLPVKPVYIVPFNTSKVDAAKSAGIDIYVDDKWENFVELNKAGICTFLYDQPWNRMYEVGYRRIKSLEDLLMYIQ